MRRLTAWIGGAVGGIAAYRLLRRRLQPAPEPSPEPAPADADARAEELRVKLAETRTAEPVVEQAPAEPAAEATVEQPPEPESPDERRRQVHEEGRAAVDEMKSDGAA
jgi:hypothetical protein